MRSRLRSERLKRNLTIEHIANEVGIKRAHYNNIELGRSKPSHDLSCKIGTYFGIIDICKLFEKDEENDI